MLYIMPIIARERRMTSSSQQWLMAVHESAWLQSHTTLLRTTISYLRGRFGRGVCGGLRRRGSGARRGTATAAVVQHLQSGRQPAGELAEDCRL